MLKLKLQNFGHLMQRVNSLEKLWCWEGLRAGGKGDDRGWDGWMASLTRRMWIWVNSGGCWWIGRPGVLQFMGSQRVGHDWATDLNWSERDMWDYYSFCLFLFSNALWITMYPRLWVSNFFSVKGQTVSVLVFTGDMVSLCYNYWALLL